MLDIKFVRENPDVVKENIRKKFQDQKIPMVDEVIALDQENRNIKQEVESLRANKNKISKQIGALMAQGKKEEAEEVKKEVAASGAKIDELSAREKEVEEKIKTIMMTIPNIIDPSVPVGKDDSENVEIERFGEPVVPDYEVPYHAEIMESFDGLDPAKRILAKKLLLEYVAERGASVIISSHNLHELEDLCDHVGLLDGQKLLLDCSVDDISASRCKFRVAFNREMDRDDFSDFSLKRFTKDGRLITFTVQGDIREQEERLRAMNPILLESFPLSLEEIFMDEMEGEEQDYADIFK